MDPKERNAEVVDGMLFVAMYRWYLRGAPAVELKERADLIESCGQQLLDLRRKLGDGGMRALLDNLDRVEKDLEKLAEPDVPALPPPPAVDAALVLKLAWEMDEIEFSVLTAKCLRSKNIFFIDELVQKTEDDLLKTKNFGRPRLREVKTLLATLGLSLGMKLDEATIAAVRAKIVQRGGGTK